MYLMRFDLRAPGKDAAERADLYQAAIEMAEWADDKGCISVVVSEHHASEDGYLPSPLTLAAAMAVRTKNVPIAVAAALLPLYDPVRLAEELITLDHLSRGRVMVVLGIGYRPVEYALHGVDFDRRGAIADEKLEQLLSVLRDAGVGPEAGEQRVTPAPFTSPMPLLAWGGKTKVAARRAGRNGLSFLAQGGGPELQDAFETAARDAGVEPGMCLIPPLDSPQNVFVHEDPDAGWAEVGPSLLVDATAYWKWNEAAGTTEGTVSLTNASTVDELRAANGSHRVVTPEAAAALVARHGPLGLHPLCGGLAPAVAWPYLERAAAAVT